MPSNKGPQGQAAHVSSTSTTGPGSTPALGRGGHGGHTSPDGTDTTAPAIDTVVDKVFTRFDADDDAALTVAELVAVLDPTASSSTLATELTAQVTVIDSDGNGTLSKAEVTAAVTALDSDADGLLDRSERATLRDDGNQTILDSILGGGGRHGGGGGRVEVSRSVTDAVDAIFTVYDADASTTISLSELVANLHSHRKGTDVSTLASELMTAVDSNSDGALSTTEITAALTALDTDGDGLLERSDHAGTSDDATVQLIGVLLHHLPVDAVSSVTA